MLVAGVTAGGVRYLLDDAPAPVVLAATAATVGLVAAFLLAYTQGLSLHTVMRALKDPPPA